MSPTTNPNFWSAISGYCALFGVILGIIAGAVKCGEITEKVKENDNDIEKLKVKCDNHISSDDCKNCHDATEKKSEVIFDLLNKIEIKRDKAREDRSVETAQFTSTLASMESKIGTFAISLQAQGRLFEQQHQFTKEIILSLKEGIGGELVHLKDRIDRIEAGRQ